MLKQIKLRNTLMKKQNRLNELLEKQSGFKQREEELTKALDEATTEEDTKEIDEQLTVLENDIKAVSEDFDGEITALRTEIENIRTEIETINRHVDTKENKTEHKTDNGGNTMEISRQEVRELVKTGAYYRNKEVIDFYSHLKQLRNVSGESLTIPQIVVNRIMDIVGDYSTIYPLVDKINCNGTARILIDTDTEPATWTEQNGTVAQGNVGTVTYVDFDGFKIGKATVIDSNILKDSIINIDAYVIKKLSRAIAMGLDKAILKGTGATYKQPVGIITALPNENQITLTDPTNVISLAKPLSLIDTGEDAPGEIVAVMHRSTYYDRVLDILALNLNGGMVGAIPAFTNNPNINGLKVVFNNFMDKDKILYGDFSKYTLVEREAMTVESDSSVKFFEDQIAYKGRGRFDGKPTKVSAFVLTTLSFTNPSDEETEEETDGET